MKKFKLEKNEFEFRKDAIRMLEMVNLEFGSVWQREDCTDEFCSVTDCNRLETDSISHDENSEIYSLNVTNAFYQRGEEIQEFISENKIKVLQQLIIN